MYTHLMEKALRTLSPLAYGLQALRKSEADQAMAEEWTPPVLSDQQRRLLAEVEEQVKTCPQHTVRVVLLSWGLSVL